MNINMKNVKLMRNENDASDKWIYISEDGVNPTTKLLVDDGTKSLAQYQADIQNLAVKNSWDRLDDLAMLIDFALTLEGSQSMSLKEFL